VASLTNNAPTQFPKGTNAVVWTVTDTANNSNTCTQNVIVADSQRPAITCPADITRSNDTGNCSAIINFTCPSATDNCSVSNVVCNPPSGSTFNVGTNTVTATATDTSGNTSNCTFKVIVNDTEKPTITCPTDVTVNTDAGVCYATGVALGTPSTHDNCGVASLTNNVPTQFPKGTNAVAWIVTDTANNSATCTQRVIVVDNEKPTLTCPSDIVRSNDTGNCSAVVSFTCPSAGDNCGVSNTVCNPLSGSTFNVGTNTVTVTATDTSGNTSNCTFKVIVEDKEKPSLTCLTNRVICVGNAVTAPTNTVDNCPGTPTVIPASTNLTACGTNSVTWSAIDASSNTNTCTETVLVYAVDSLTASEGSAPTGPTNYVCSATNGVVTVTAAPCGGLPTNSLPTCWTMSANGVSLGSVTSVDVDKTAPGITTVIATAGTSVKSNVIVVVKTEVKAVTFTSDHGVLTDYNTDFAGGGGTVYTPRGWQKNLAQNNPITHTQGVKVSANVTIKVEPTGVTFNLAGSGTALNFSTNGVVSTGADQILPVTSTAALAAQVDIINESVNWTATFGGAGGLSCGAGASGSHKIYVLWGSPGAGPTLKRIDWACTEAQGAVSITAAAVKFRDGIASSPGYSVPRVWNLDSWQFLDSGDHGDCITLAKLAREGLVMIGIPSDHRWSYPTADGTTGFPAVSGNSCHNVATKVFQYLGESFNAKLVYPGNNFEGFFTVSDPDIKAYTIYTPGGAFANATYYYLEVLQFAAGAGGDQFWVWDGTQTHNGVTVTNWVAVPGAAHIPVPSIP
jgi:hypothetical protein